MRLSDCCSCFPCFRQKPSSSSSTGRNGEIERFSLLEHENDSVSDSSVSGRDVKKEQAFEQKALMRRMTCGVCVGDILRGKPKKSAEKLFELMTGFFGRGDPCILISTAPNGRVSRSDPFMYEKPEADGNKSITLAPYPGFETKPEYFSGRVVFEIRKGGQLPSVIVKTDLRVGLTDVKVFDTIYNSGLNLAPTFDTKFPHANELRFKITHPPECREIQWSFKRLVPQEPHPDKRRPSAVLSDASSKRAKASQPYEIEDENELTSAQLDLVTGQEYAHISERPVSGPFDEITSAAVSLTVDSGSRPVSFVIAPDPSVRERDSGICADSHAAKEERPDSADFDNIDLATPPSEPPPDERTPLFSTQSKVLSLKRGDARPDRIA